MTIQTISQIYNPVTGVFGTGQVQFFSSSGTWTVPQGIGKVRVRLWGAGGGQCTNSSNYGGGGGGGFALKTIYDLTGVTSVSVVVGAGGQPNSGSTLVYGGTSSFGSYVSATGGAYCGGSTTANAGGTGVGGDINTVGGYGGYGGGSASGGGGGAASVFGNGGYNPSASTIGSATGGAGAGNGNPSASTTSPGGNGFLTSGGFYNTGTNIYVTQPQSSSLSQFSIDMLGTGGGGAYGQAGVNGGGSGYNGQGGGFPGGGAGQTGSSNIGGGGLVIVEW